jgi:hypothetical protein
VKVSSVVKRHQHLLVPALVLLVPVLVLLVLLPWMLVAKAPCSISRYLFISIAEALHALHHSHCIVTAPRLHRGCIVAAPHRCYHRSSASCSM